MTVVSSELSSRGVRRTHIGPKVGFDNERYLREQKAAIMERVGQLAIEKLKELRGCEVHMTHIPMPGDETGFRRLGINLTSDPQFPSRNLFVT